MANPEYFECFMNGRVHHRRHDSKEWKVGYAPRDVTPTGRLDVRKPNYQPLVPRTAEAQRIRDAFVTPVVHDYGSEPDTDRSTPDVNGGGGLFDGGGASGDY